MTSMKEFDSNAEIGCEVLIHRGDLNNKNNGVWRNSAVASQNCRRQLLLSANRYMTFGLMDSLFKNDTGRYLK